MQIVEETITERIEICNYLAIFIVKNFGHVFSNYRHVFSNFRHVFSKTFFHILKIVSCIYHVFSKTLQNTIKLQRNLQSLSDNTTL